MKKLLLLTITLFLLNTVIAQNFEIGLNVGGAIYTGDIEVNGKNFSRQKRSNVGAFVRVPLNSSFVIRGQAYHGQFYANEKKYPTTNYRATRGFSFNTTFTELTARLEWHFLKLDNQFYFENQDPTMSVYSFMGFGATIFKPQTTYNTSTTNIGFDNVSVDKDAEYSKTSPLLALGIGGKYNVTNTLGLGLEVSAQKPFTDYIDGISKLSVSKTNDYYFFAHLLISYNFGNSIYNKGNGYAGYNRGRRKSGCPTF